MTLSSVGESGLEVISKLRSTRETELAREYPLYESKA